MSRMTDYPKLNEELRSLCGGVPHAVTLLANASALLSDTLEEINWAGFYLLRDGVLYLGPFQGKTACTVIRKGKGVCGAAVLQNGTVRVPDVHLFPGHIACDSASRSEIVVPLRRDGNIIGVMDIDSPIPNRFSAADEAGLNEFARILENHLATTDSPLCGI